MKKILLFVLMLGLGVSTYAQKAYTFKKEAVERTIYEKPAMGIDPIKSTPLIESEIEYPLELPSSSRNVNDVSIINIGTMANAWTYGSNNSGNQRSLVWAEPDLNTVTSFHRNGGALDPGGFSGDYAYDISFDGGQTWTNQIECYVAKYATGSDGDAARYPNHGIYNPTGSVEDAYLVFWGPNLDGSNSNTPGAGWGGYSYGVANISDPADTTGNYNTKSSSPADGIYNYIPDAMDVTANGLSIIVDNNVNWTSGSGVYEGSLNVNMGYYDEDEADFVYEASLFDYETPVGYGSPWYTTVAFAPDGMTGYIAILGNNGETWNAGGLLNSIYPIFWKTTDGGDTWDGPNAIQIDGPDGIGGIVNNLLTDEQIAGIYAEPLPARDEIPYTYTGDFEIAVDDNGNLHIAGIVCAAGEGTETGISFYIEDSLGAVLDVFTTDGGTTWFAEEMGRIQRYDATLTGDMVASNRTQITTSADADKIFISWLDTDPTLPGVEDNSRPNIWCRGFDPSTYVKTTNLNYPNDGEEDGPTNVTYFTAGWNRALFGTTPKTALDVPGGGYNIPYTFLELTDGDPGLEVQIKFVQNFTFTDADFLITSNNEIFDANESIVSFSQNYPNPFTGETYVTVNLTQGADLSVEVYSLTGQIISSQQIGYTPKGSSKIAINGSNLPSGVYFYTITAGESRVTRKMIVE